MDNLSSIVALNAQPAGKADNEPTPSTLAEQAFAAAFNAFETWRRNKTTAAEPIPDKLWQQIFALEPFYSASQLRRVFNISKRQYDAKRGSRPVTPPPASGMSRLDSSPLCQVTIKKDSPYALAPLPSAKTLIVEFCRADGCLMKIHTTQDSIPTLMSTFFSGESEC